MKKGTGGTGGTGFYINLLRRSVFKKVIESLVPLVPIAKRIGIAGLFRAGFLKVLSLALLRAASSAPSGTRRAASEPIYNGSDLSWRWRGRRYCVVGAGSAATLRSAREQGYVPLWCWPTDDGGYAYLCEMTEEGGQ